MATDDINEKTRHTQATYCITVFKGPITNTRGGKAEFLTLGQIYARFLRPAEGKLSSDEYFSCVDSSDETEKAKAKKDKQSGDYFLAALLDGAEDGHGERKRENIKYHSALTIDLDELTPDDPTPAETFRLAYPDTAAIFYTTYSHRPSAPRWRAFIPLAVNLTSAAVTEITKTVVRGCKWDIPNPTTGRAAFDNASLSRSQAMFLPRTPRGDTFYKCVQCEGAPLDPDHMPRAARVPTNGATNYQPPAAPTAANSKMPRGVSTGVIPQGQRNDTLHNDLIKILTRYGDTAQTWQLWEQRVNSCETPLPDPEIQSIRNSALEYFRTRIETDPKYKTPAEYSSAGRAEPIDGEPDYMPRLLDGQASADDVSQGRLFARLHGDHVRYANPGTMEHGTWYALESRGKGLVWRENEGAVFGNFHNLTDAQHDQAKARRKEYETLCDELRDKYGDAIQINGKTGMLEYKPNNDIMPSSDGATEVVETLPPEDQKKLKRANAANYESFALSQAADTYRKSGKIKAALDQAKPYLDTKLDDLDRDTNILNTPSGVIDLRTGELRFAQPDDLCTRITATVPAITAQGRELWENFLDVFTLHDEALKEYLRLALGQTLFGEVYEQLLMFYGDGQNGKSVLINTLLRVVGDYGIVIPSEMLLKTTHNKDSKLVELFHRRLAVMAELPEGRSMDSGMLKTLNSTDPIWGEAKFKQGFHFTPQQSCILCTNVLPRVNELNYGTWRRIVVIPCRAVISKRDQIPNYEKILFERAGSDILSWLIGGAFDAHRRLKHKLALPPVVCEATKKYRIESDWLQQFIDDCCTKGPGESVSVRELFECYVKYCDDNGEYQRGRQEFNAAMVKKGFEQARTKKERRWNGIRKSTIYEQGKDYFDD